MRRIGIAVWVSLVIALEGLPAGMQAQGADDGLVRNGISMRGQGAFCMIALGMGMME